MIPFRHPYSFSEEEALDRAKEIFEAFDGRRTVRHYARQGVDRRIIEYCLRAASTAPSGAHKQPWHFVVVEDGELKSRIRAAAEEEEKTFYSERAPNEWLEALAPLGTDENKPFLEDAPYLIAVFARNFDVLGDGRKIKNYYVQESVGIATGLLIAALHHCGLSTLTHTPSPMGFLNELLGRPANERPFLLLVVGYPAEHAHVPDITRKELSSVATFL